jgi:hypothetical protein
LSVINQHHRVVLIHEVFQVTHADFYRAFAECVQPCYPLKWLTLKKIKDDDLTTEEADQMHTCLHEAGHAVAAAYVEMPFDYVTAVRVPGKSNGHVQEGDLTGFSRTKHAIVVLAARVVIMDLPVFTPPEWTARDFYDDFYEDFGEDAEGVRPSRIP